MEWCSLLKGDISYFREVIQKDKSTILNETEKNVYESYEKEKKIGEKVDTIICLSQFTKDILINDYSLQKEKIKLILNGLKDEGKQLSKKRRNIARRIFGFTQKDFIILFAGRLEETKGVDFLIKAFKGISDISPNARLVLIGDGEFSKYLLEANGYWNKITFTGRLEKECLYQFYQIADVGVMPSINEQCSYVVIEMMMFGLPIVTTDSAGLSDMLCFENKEDCIVHIQRTTNETIISVDELKEKIMDRCNDNRYRQSIRINYEKRFRLDLMENNYLHLYDSFGK
jgi:glycosyltransferase